MNSTAFDASKIPVWNSANPKQSFDITRQWSNFQNPEASRKNI